MILKLDFTFFFSSSTQLVFLNALDLTNAKGRWMHWCSLNLSTSDSKELRKMGREQIWKGEGEIASTLLFTSLYGGRESPSMEQSPFSRLCARHLYHSYNTPCSYPSEEEALDDLPQAGSGIHNLYWLISKLLFCASHHNDPNTLCSVLCPGRQTIDKAQ